MVDKVLFDWVLNYKPLVTPVGIGNSIALSAINNFKDAFKKRFVEVDKLSVDCKDLNSSKFFDREQVLSKTFIPTYYGKGMRDHNFFLNVYVSKADKKFLFVEGWFYDKNKKFFNKGIRVNLSADLIIFIALGLMRMKNHFLYRSDFKKIRINKSYRQFFFEPYQKFRETQKSLNYETYKIVLKDGVLR